MTRKWTEADPYWCRCPGRDFACDNYIADGPDGEYLCRECYPGSNRELFDTTPLGQWIYLTAEKRSVQKVMACEPCRGDLVPQLLDPKDWTVGQLYSIHLNKRADDPVHGMSTVPPFVGCT